MAKRLNVYFIHAQWLKDRERTISEFQKLTSKYQFKGIKSVKIRVITDYDPQDINGEVIGKCVSYAPIKDEDENAEPKLSNYNSFLKNLHIFQLSNSLKHYKALSEIASSSDENDINLIIEDDVLYEDKLCMSLERVIADIPNGYDMVFLGMPSNLDPQKRSQVKFQSVKDVFPQILPYCDSYLVSKSAAKNLADNFLPVKFVNHVQMSYVMEKSKVKGILSVPNIFMDGSKFGVFLSILTPNNALVFNNDYMRAKVFLQNYETLTAEDKKSLETLVKDSPLNAHPDFMHVKALFMMQQKKFKEAETVFESALKIYQGNNCIINHESQFLKDYIRLYKDLQDLEESDLYQPD